MTVPVKVEDRIAMKFDDGFESRSPGAAS